MHTNKGLAPIPLNKGGSGVVLWVIIAAVVLGGGYVVVQKSKSKVESVEPVIEQSAQLNAQNTAQSQTVVPADWKTYRNEKYGFEFKSPARRVELFPASSADYLSGDREFYGIYGVSNQDYAARVDVYPGTPLSAALQSNRFVNTLKVSGNAAMNGIIWTRVGDTDYLVEKRDTTYHLSGYQDLITPILSTFRFTK